MEIKLSKNDVQNMIRERFSLDDLIRILSENDRSDEMYEEVAKKMVKYVKIDTDKIAQRLYSEIISSCRITWRQIKETVYERVAKKLAEKVLETKRIKLVDKEIEQ